MNFIGLVALGLMYGVLPDLVKHRSPSPGILCCVMPMNCRKCCFRLMTPRVPSVGMVYREMLSRQFIELLPYVSLNTSRRGECSYVHILRWDASATIHTHTFFFTECRAMRFRDDVCGRRMPSFLSLVGSEEEKRRS